MGSSLLEDDVDGLGYKKYFSLVVGKYEATNLWLFQSPPRIKCSRGHKHGITHHFYCSIESINSIEITKTCIFISFMLRKSVVKINYNNTTRQPKQQKNKIKDHFFLLKCCTKKIRMFFYAV
jgi:hypothetical protein